MSITPKNWDTFQHYKDRSPAWIKLHRGLLHDFAFSRLPLASRALAPMLWLLASEYDGGKITGDFDEVAYKLRITKNELCEALNPLIESGFFILDSDALAACKQEAIPEKRDIEKIEEEKSVGRSLKATRPPDEQFETFKKEYPKRKGANPWTPARAQWDVAIKSGATAEQIIGAVRAGIGFDRDKIGTEFIPRAMQWLKERRYRDQEPAQRAALAITLDNPRWNLWKAHFRDSGQNFKADLMDKYAIDGKPFTVPSEYPPGYRSAA